MFLDSTIFTWIILPLLIYFARITDVTLGTMRIMSLSRGLRNVAPIFGFFEIIIWLLAIRQIFNHLDDNGRISLIHGLRQSIILYSSPQLPKEIWSLILRFKYDQFVSRLIDYYGESPEQLLINILL